MNKMLTNLKSEYLLYEALNRSNNLYANLWINVRTGEAWVRSYTLLVPDHYRYCDDYPDIRVTDNYNGAIKKRDFPRREEVLRRVIRIMENEN